MKKIYGTEHEFGITAVPLQEPELAAHSMLEVCRYINQTTYGTTNLRLTPNKLLSLMFADEAEGLNGINEYDVLGRRIYNDHEHPEIAAAETDTIQDAAAGAIAAQLAAKRVGGVYDFDGLGEVRIVFDTMVSDHVGIHDNESNTWGTHLGVSYKRVEREDWHSLALGSAQVVNAGYGAAYVEHDGRLRRLQKVSGMSSHTLEGIDTVTWPRAIVNLRNEPHLPYELNAEYGRRHVIGLDSLQFPLPNAFRFVNQEIVEHMIMKGAYNGKLIFERPEKEYQKVGRDSPLNDTKVQPIEGPEVTWTEYQRRLLGFAGDALDLPEHILQWFGYIEEFCEVFRQDKKEAANWLDGIAKYFILEKMMKMRERSDVKFKRGIELSFHKLMPEGNLLDIFAKSKELTIHDPTNIRGRAHTFALKEPPPTRARERGQYVQSLLDEYGEVPPNATIYWERAMGLDNHFFDL